METYIISSLQAIWKYCNQVIFNHLQAFVAFSLVKILLNDLTI